MSWAGAPCELLVDAATELNSEQFSNFVQGHNIRLTTISPEAQFQNGRAERHGAILKTMLTKYESEQDINNYHELSQALVLVYPSKECQQPQERICPGGPGARQAHPLAWSSLQR